MIDTLIVIVFKGGVAFSMTLLNGFQWGVSIALGIGSLHLAVLVRLISDFLLRTIFDI